ncbi:hypothetical protein SAMN02982985_00621 [Rugamonas rubra]|uniref:Uncharacterized protein n=1 Tax=Rugamonas rubra TaxID=758825 RepID=A0A1I4IKJ8_9BURK|nr:hypothetical protein SAMN02982985_00621 [Rugamonas rubra]
MVDFTRGVPVAGYFRTELWLPRRAAAAFTAAGRSLPHKPAPANRSLSPILATAAPAAATTGRTERTGHRCRPAGSVNDLMRPTRMRRRGRDHAQAGQRRQQTADLGRAQTGQLVVAGLGGAGGAAAVAALDDVGEGAGLGARHASDLTVRHGVRRAQRRLAAQGAAGVGDGDQAGPLRRRQAGAAGAAPVDGSTASQGQGKDDASLCYAAHVAHFTSPVWPIVQPPAFAASAALLAHSSIGSLATSSNSKNARQSWDSQTSMNSQNSISSSRLFILATAF